jgi:hypothetical protein
MFEFAFIRAAFADERAGGTITGKHPSIYKTQQVHFLTGNF